MRLLFPFIFLLAAVAEARVFDLKKERFSSYLLVGMSQSNLKDTPFVGESSAANFSDPYGMLTSGEFGFNFGQGPLGFRFGFEIIKPLILEGTGQNAGGGNLYTYSSTISVLTPKI